MSREPKFAVGQTVLFRGQDYSLSGVNRRVCRVTRAVYDATVGRVVYDLVDLATGEPSHNNYEDMINRWSFK